MHHRALVAAIGITTLTMTFSCAGPDEPVATDEERRIGEAYADLVILSESARLGKMSDTTRPYEHQADSILSIYGLTREEFETTFHRTALDPERSRLIFNIAIQRIRARPTHTDSSAPPRGRPN
jgi:hypothetical protein